MQLDPKAVARLADQYTAAWNSGSAAAVASFFAEDGEIVINRGEPWIGRARVADMAAGFFADVPDMALTCDEIRCAGSKVQGWEEWDLDGDLKIRSSRGWYDAEDHASQVARSA
jgi:ketosteroid isomerase-like protein